MEERLRFVARLLDGEAMTDVCREFGVSRKTGCEIFDRYKEHGLEALTAVPGAIRQPIAAADRATHRRLQARPQRGEAVSSFIKHRTAEGRPRWMTMGRYGSLRTPDRARVRAKQLLGEWSREAIRQAR